MDVVELNGKDVDQDAIAYVKIHKIKKKYVKN
jgi:hypothetical protein